jgi:hypothetical protein
MQSADKCLYPQNVAHVCLQHQNKKKWKLAWTCNGPFWQIIGPFLENNAFLATLMDLFQKISSRLIKLIVTARPNLSWHYSMCGTKTQVVQFLKLKNQILAQTQIHII